MDEGQVRGPDAKPYPFSRDKDGYAPFSALAGFALAQAVALSAAAKGDERDDIVIAIYAILVAFSFCWVVMTLRAVRTQLDPTDDSKKHEVEARAYDRPSITYGRFVLAWTVVLGFIVGGLALAGYLPNQTNRISFTDTELPRSVYDPDDLPAYTQSANRRPEYDVWLDWIAGYTKAVRHEENQQLFLIEQQNEFKNSYRAFVLTLACNEKDSIEQRVAYLVRYDPDSSRPSYRQLATHGTKDKEKNRIEIVVPDANKGERLFILVYVQSPNKEMFPTKGNVKLRFITPSARPKTDSVAP